jgi:hypothetical protein
VFLHDSDRLAKQKFCVVHKIFDFISMRAGTRFALSKDSAVENLFFFLLVSLINMKIHNDY